jgi:hypothetical protein
VIRVFSSALFQKATTRQPSPPKKNPCGESQRRKGAMSPGPIAPGNAVQQERLIDGDVVLGHDGLALVAEDEVQEGLG